MEPHLTWDLVRDVKQLFDYPFMVNAFQAGTIVAVTAAIVGWFMVLRRETFAGHTLAVIGFPGAAGAILLGVSASYGFFTFSIAAALVIALVSRGRRGGYSEESAVIGTVQAFGLSTGFLFLSLTHRNVSGAAGLLFGSFIGISHDQVVQLLIGAGAVLLVLGFVARPLLFASVDPDVAAARRVPVQALGVAFFLILGVAAAEASQVTGSLLVFSLLALPPATAELLVAKPGLCLALAVVIGLLVTWLGLALSYYNDYPIGFHVTSLAFGAYVLAQVWNRARRLSFFEKVRA